MSLHRIVYLSFAARHLDGGEVAQILAASRRNNSQRRITGLLVFHDGRFFQVLEGDAAVVAGTRDRIALDRRHFGMKTLFEGEVPERSFPDWSMGYAEMHQLPQHLQDFVFSISELIPPDSVRRGDDPIIRREVRSFLAGFNQLDPSVIARMM